MADSSTPDFRAPTDEEDLIPWLNAKREKGRKRMPERQWKLNLSYMLGEQWIVWDSQKRTFTQASSNAGDPNAPVRVTVNKVGSITEHYISRLLKANPEPEARPVGDEPKDVDAAKVASRIMISEINRLEWDTEQVDLYFWVVPLGVSYLQVTWDPDDGPHIGDDDGTAIFQGDISMDIVPGFELSVDPAGKRRNLSDAKWACRTVTMTNEAIWEKWGVVVHGGESSSKSLAEEVYDLAERADDRNSATDDTSQVHQFWLRPSRAKPEGMVVTYTGKQFLEKPIDYPYDHGKLPFVEFDLLPGMGVREGRTWMKDLIPMQTDYNDARSREATIRRTLVPKILAPTGSIDAKRVSSRVEIINYNPIGQPPRMDIPDGRWMAQYEQAMDRGDNEMGERSGQNDVNSGDLQASMPAAAILALQEADDTKLAIPAKLNAVGVQQFGLMILDLVRQFWDEERVVRTWSQDGFLEVSHFTGANVADQLDIHVNAESSLPRSKSARAQLAMELRAEGLLQDPRKYVRMLDVPGVDLIVEELDLDAKQQKRETNKLLQGQTVPINSFDNHVIHYTELTNFCKTEDYENLDPSLKAFIDAHRDAHLEIIMSQAQAGAVPGAPIDQGGLPTAGAPAAGGEGPTGQSEYLDPMTGKPAPGTEVGRGNAPSSLTQSRVGAGIGGPGQPGPVPGVSGDQQSARMGN